MNAPMRNFQVEGALVFIDIFFQSLALIVAFVVIGQFIAKLIASNAKGKDDG